MVRVRGVSGARLDPNRKRLGAQIFVTRLEDIEVEEAALEDPFAATVQPIAGLFNGAADGHFVRRTHVRGTLTWQMPGRFLMADRTGAAFVAADAAPIPVGDTVDVVGFRAEEIMGSLSPMLKYERLPARRMRARRRRRLFRRSSCSTVLRTGRSCALKRA